MPANYHSWVILLILCCSILPAFGKHEILVKWINCGGLQLTGTDGLLYKASTSCRLTYILSSDAFTHLSNYTLTCNEFSLPSAKGMVAHGVKPGEINGLLLEKIEELALYRIRANATNKQQRA